MAQYVTTPDGARHKFDDGVTPEQMQQALASYAKPPAAPAPNRKRVQSMPLALGFPPIQPWMADILPSVGGALGGVTGAALGAPTAAVSGPFGPAIAAGGGAYIGGGLGEMGRRAVMGEPQDPGATSIAALLQGLSQAAGGGLVGSSKRVAREMMQVGLKPGIKMARVAPDIVSDALEQGATVGNVLGGGSKATGKVLGQRAAVTEKALETADAARPPGWGAQGIKVRMSGLMPRIDDVVSKSSPIAKSEREQAKAVIEEFIDNHPVPKTPTELKAMKKEMWERAEAIIKKTFGADHEPIEKIINQAPIDARVYYKAGQRAQEFLERIPGSQTGVKGGIGAAERATQKAINVNKAVQNAEDIMRSGVSQWIPQTLGRGGAAATGATFGALSGNTPEERVRGGITGGLIGSGVAHPAAMSRLAHVANNPVLLEILRQQPRLAELLFNSGSMPDTLNRR